MKLSTYIFILIFLSATKSLYAQEDLKIVSYNIFEGMRLDSTPDKSHFVRWVKEMDPDILALQEVQRFTQRSLEEIARKFGHPYAVLLKEEGYPVALTSKYPIANVSRVTDNMHHGFIQAQVKDYQILVVHFSPHKYWKRREEADLIISTIQSKPKYSKWVVMGDFNALSPVDSPNYSDGKLLAHMERNAARYAFHDNLAEGALDYSVISKFLDAGLLDAFHLKNRAFESSLPTKGFLEQNPQRAENRIDYIFISKKLKNNVIHSAIIKDEFTDHYSDHYPVLLELQP